MVKTKYKVLLIEDDRNDVERTQWELRDFADVIIAKDRLEFEHKLNIEDFDVVIVDVNLAAIGLSGSEAIRVARRLQPQTPVIVLTGSVGDDDAAAIAIQEGAIDYLIKDRQRRLKQAIQNAYEKKDKAGQIRLAELGLLLAGAAHDLNNQLGGIAIAAELLLTSLKPTGANERMLQMIMNNALRGGDMVKQMTEFAKGGEGVYKSVTAEFLLGEIGQMIRQSSFSTSLKVDIQADIGTAKVRCDPTQIYQVFLNLCVNAKDAMPDGGVLTLVAHNTNDHVCFSVSDTGTGIPDEVLPRIFDPFVTTKKERGTGLGLHIVKNILKDHNGRIEVETKPGGTTFRFYLPVDREKAPVQVHDGSGKIVVLVDDEQLFRAAVQLHLETAKYKVLSAGNGPEALAHFRTQPRIDLLITDMTMPIMCGRDLVKTLRGQCFNLPVIFLSGQAELDIPEDLGAAAVLRKPIPMVELFKAMEKALADPPKTATREP